jgi:hypothetical protein
MMHKELQKIKRVVIDPQTCLLLCVFTIVHMEDLLHAQVRLGLAYTCDQ